MKLVLDLYDSVYNTETKNQQQNLFENHLYSIRINGFNKMESDRINFYREGDAYGCFSNFSKH